MVQLKTSDVCVEAQTREQMHKHTHSHQLNCWYQSYQKGIAY